MIIVGIFIGFKCFCFLCYDILKDINYVGNFYYNEDCFVWEFFNLFILLLYFVKFNYYEYFDGNIVNIINYFMGWFENSIVI